jgi:hypothetical protein
LTLLAVNVTYNVTSIANYDLFCEPRVLYWALRGIIWNWEMSENISVMLDETYYRVFLNDALVLNTCIF